MKSKFRVDGLTGIVVLPREIEVTSESLFLAAVKYRYQSEANQILDGFSMSLLLWVQ